LNEGNGAESLLIVDDDHRLLRLCEVYLQRVGFEVVACAEGNVAIDAARERRFDLLLTDLRMPGMTGTQLIETILEIQPQILVVVMSGSTSMDGDAANGIAADYPFINKPFALSNLEELIREVFEKGSRNA
jgi:DNA-binding NtrC family response regulator